MVEAAREARMKFLFVAKEADHEHLYEWVAEQRHLGETVRIERTDDRGRIHRYEYALDLPIRGQSPAVHVNWIDYQLIKTDYPFDEALARILLRT